MAYRTYVESTHTPVTCMIGPASPLTGYPTLRVVLARAQVPAAGDISIIVEWMPDDNLEIEWIEGRMEEGQVWTGSTGLPVPPPGQER